MRAGAPKPGSAAERRRERIDRSAALVLALLAHAVFLTLGNRSTDALALAEAPGAGPGGPMSVVALSEDAAERLLARLGPPMPILEVGARGATARPEVPLPERRTPALPPPALGPLVAPLPDPPASAPDLPATPLTRRRALLDPGPLAEAPPPQPEGGSATPPTPQVAAPPEPTVGPDAAGLAPPTGTDGERARGASASSGDDAPFLDAGTTDALVLHRVVPQYPLAARRLGHEGSVWVRIEVGSGGEVTAARVERSSGHPELDKAALLAVGAWRFDAAAVERRGLGSRFRVSLRFSLRE
ncbi:MAG: TonB family protein [Planctomycetaceae bacterium]|nr:TonB family protein [Planctomycetaceae bacterium]